MTRKEFSTKSEALGRIINWCLPCFLIAIFCMLIGGQFLSAYIERHYHTNRWDTPGGIFLCVALFGGLIGLTFFERHLAAKWGLSCRECGKPFFDEKPRRRILFTGHCPKCKTNVFEEGAATNRPAFRGMNREEFQLKHQSLTRQYNRRAIRLLIFMFVAMIGCGWVARHLRDFVDRGGLDWVTLSQWRWCAGIILSVVILSFFSLFVFSALGKFKPRDLPCPECGRSLVGSAGAAALEKGICIYCGCGLFNRPLKN